MDIRSLILFLAAFFVAFVLEHLPLPPLLSWFQPQWLLLLMTVLVLHEPERFGLWMAVPFGLMLDVEQHVPLGLHVLLFAVHIVVLQALYRRLAHFHFLQLMAVVFLLVLLQQMLRYWVLMLMGQTVSVQMWQPALVSALVWPWLYAVVFVLIRRLNLS